jgi:DNA-binding MarR family transcriptional regulator
MVQPKKNDRRRLVWLSEDDLSAAARLLAAVGNSSAEADNRAEDKGTSAKTYRRQALKRASLSLYLRQRRTQCLGRMFVNEPPFQMLLSLYVNEDREPDMTITRLADLAWLSHSTTLRWVDELITGGWISRADVAEDGRKSRLRLTEKACRALDDLFAWPA